MTLIKDPQKAKKILTIVLSLVAVYVIALVLTKMIASRKSMSKFQGHAFSGSGFANASANATTRGNGNNFPLELGSNGGRVKEIQRIINKMLKAVSTPQRTKVINGKKQIAVDGKWGKDTDKGVNYMSFLVKPTVAGPAYPFAASLKLRDNSTYGFGRFAILDESAYNSILGNAGQIDETCVLKNK